ncbi:hypothetical protein IGI04_042942, partial [Brassica rapa subsp. trilocularis]
MSSVHGSVHGQSVCANGQARTSCVQPTWAKITRTVHRKGQHADMCTDGRSRTSCVVLTGLLFVLGRPVCTDEPTDHTRSSQRSGPCVCLTDVLCVLTDVLCVLTDVLRVLTDTRTHTDSHRRPACADGRPACADGRPVCADGRPVCTDVHTDTHGQPLTSCVPREPKSPEQSRSVLICVTEGQPEDAVCADGTATVPSYRATWAKIHPTDAKITREAKNAQNYSFEESLDSDKKQSKICHKEFRMSSGDQKLGVDIRLDHETPTFVACKRHENSLNHPYEACKKSDSNSKGRHSLEPPTPQYPNGS